MNKLRRVTFIVFTVALTSSVMSGYVYAHVPHDIIYSLDPSPDYAETGMVLASSTQFGEAHLISHSHGELFQETHAGMGRVLVTGHTYSPDFKNDGTVYTVSSKGYYKSSDRGESWVLQEQFAEEEVLHICTAPDYTKSKDLYVLTTQGIHLVGNEGRDIRTLLPKDKVTFGKLIVSGGKLYAHAVYYQEQKMVKGMEHIDYLSGTVDVMDLKTGKWAALSPGFAQEIISDIDVANNSDVLVALKNGNVLLSENAGASWKDIFKHDGDYVAKLRFSPDYANDKTMVVGTAKGFVFFSDSKGQKWESRSNGLSRWVHHTNILMKSIRFSPDYKNDKTIFLGKTTGIYKTTDCGEFWRHINIWNTKWTYYVHPAPGTSELFTATYNSGISRSPDNGDTWESANIGITAAFANGMVLSPNYENDNSIFVVDIATGPYRSTDSGRSWSRIPELNPRKIYDKPSLFRELGVSNNFKDDGVMLVFLVPRHVLGVKDRRMVFKFNDKTKEVKQVYVERGDCYVNSFAFSPKTSTQDRMYCASSSGVSMSTDKGDTWKNIFNKVGIQQMFISPNVDNDGLIYLMDKDGKIHRSSDNGESFTQTDMNLNGQYVNNLTFSPDYARDQTLYVTTFGEGVLKSTDNGATWSYFGLKGKFLYTGLAFSSNYTKDKTIFAPTIDGVFRSTDNGNSWEDVFYQTQFLAKDVFFSFKDPAGREIPIVFNTSKLMKDYDMYDDEVCPEIFIAKPRQYAKISSPKAYLGTYYKFNGGAGYAVEVPFYGTAIEYKTVTGPGLGIADIILDGKNVGRLDLYSAQQEFDVTGYTGGELEAGAHTLRIEATGQKNPKSSGTAITFNAANIQN
ncbi:Ycf48-like protein [Planctomycetes bacterium CA13]|uniref:Ycf48-like protein n=1 Tax=Novipirellula herctigrandis TaxID=2527986 RepID=A0A5C5Z387_9BACT|nr:Ycf48-like protein [Planctomycetes bacterium CA13]